MKCEMSETVIDGKLIPKRIQLETFYGCNARCTMCAISKPATRRIGAMTMEMFRSVVDSMVQYKDYIEKVDLFSLGEPLLDTYLFDRIRYLKEKGFHGIAISTNAHLLFEVKQRMLLDSGIDTVIFSIDGFKKETHEAIRQRTKFEQVVGNCLSTIRMRNEGGYLTRFVVRFIRQWSNRDEWEPFRRFWESKLTARKKDLIIVYDVNGMGGEMYSKGDLLSEREINPEIERMPCHQVFDRLIVLADGSVPLCCEDSPRATFNFGNVAEANPLDIWNSAYFRSIRDLHKKGKKNNLKMCADCTMLYSEAKTEVIEPKTSGKGLDLEGPSIVGTSAE